MYSRRLISILVNMCQGLRLNARSMVRLAPPGHQAGGPVFGAFLTSTVHLRAEPHSVRWVDVFNQVVVDDRSGGPVGVRLQPGGRRRPAPGGRWVYVFNQVVADDPPGGPVGVRLQPGGRRRPIRGPVGVRLQPGGRRRPAGGPVGVRLQPGGRRRPAGGPVGVRLQPGGRRRPAGGRRRTSSTTWSQTTDPAGLQWSAQCEPIEIGRLNSVYQCSMTRGDRVSF